MGALPSKESHEGPNEIYFGNNTGVVTFRLPLTPHFFPGPDCLAFKEVYRVRDSQSCKYSFNIREAFAVLPEDAARDFKAAQDVDWGPEAEAADPSLHYHDSEVYTRLVENDLLSTPTGVNKQNDSSSISLIAQRQSSALVGRHLRRSIEHRRELYQMLVVEPTADALVDTDAEMRELFDQEQQWRAARDVVRRHRAYVRQQHMSDAEKQEVDDKEVVTVDVSAEELAAAEDVPPPRKWLRPIPEVVVERMSMEDALAAHRTYRERHNLPTEMYPSPSTVALQSVGTEPHQVPPVDPQVQEQRDYKCNLGRGPSGTHYAKSEEIALNVLDVNGRQPLVEYDTLNEQMLKSYPSFQDDQLPFEMEEQYMDGRVHLVAYQGVNYLFAYNPQYVRAMGKKVVVDGSLVEERRRQSGATQSPRCRSSFTTTHTVATRQADEFDDPNQRRAYEIFQPIYTRYYLPVMPVRVLGVDGFLPCTAEEVEQERACSGGAAAAAAALGGSISRSTRRTSGSHSPGAAALRGAPWVRGVAGDEEEEEYQEHTLPQKYGVPPPPVLRSCRFIHAVMGDKILNRTSILGCMTFRERCINAGLPDAIVCPLWGVMALNDIPQLQFQREVELRLLAAIHEIDDGDMRIRAALEKQHRWNNYVEFTNSPMYGFIVTAPPERRFRADAEGKLREVGAEEDDAASCCSSSGGDQEKHNEESSPQQQRQQQSSHRKTKQILREQRAAPGAACTAAEIPETMHPFPAEQQSGCSQARSPRDHSLAKTLTTTATATASDTAKQSSNANTSLPGSDTESHDEFGGSTSARSAAHNTSLPAVSITPVSNLTKGDNSSPLATTGSSSSNSGRAQPRVKRTREGATCLGGCAAPETAEQSAALQDAITHAEVKASCLTKEHADSSDGSCSVEDACLGIAEPPPELNCVWSFKRRRLGITEEVTVNPNYSTEEWMPMVNPVTKDSALACLGVRVTLRGRVALVRYTADAVRKVFYYFSQASAPIFCLPYVGPPQPCPNVYLESVLRIPKPASLPRTLSSPVPQNGLPPPTAAHIRCAVDAYRQGRVSCYVFSNLNDRAGNPPTSCCRNHRRDDVLIEGPQQAGVTSSLILAQLPVKADARCALEWYRKSLPYGAAVLAPPLDADEEGGGTSATPGAAAQRATSSTPYASWPTLLDAPAPCDGDVLVVCPRTHRWIRMTTLLIITGLMAEHTKMRNKADEITQPLPILHLYDCEHFPEEVEKCYDGLTVKNMDSEGMQCSFMHMRSFFSYNGIIELVLDRLRTVVESQLYEDKDDEGWLILHEPPFLSAAAQAQTTGGGTLSISTPTSSVSSTPTTSRNGFSGSATTNNTTAATTVVTSQKYMESSSYFIWSFVMAGQRYFFGTKPRFIRLALQRQKQNQRRRQKRKEKDGVVAAEKQAKETPTTTVPLTSGSGSGIAAVAAGGSAGKKKGRTTTAVAAATDKNSAEASPDLLSTTMSNTMAMSTSSGSSHSSGTTAVQHNHPRNAATSATLTATAAPNTHLLPPPPFHQAQMLNGNGSITSSSGSSNNGVPYGGPSPLTEVQPRIGGRGGSNSCVSQEQAIAGRAAMMHMGQPHPIPSPHEGFHSIPPSSASSAPAGGVTCHVPYAPLPVSADDRIEIDDRNEMQACRQRHRQWISCRGLLIVPGEGEEHSNNNNAHGGHYHYADGQQLQQQQRHPQSLDAIAAAAAKWSSPPLAGERGWRRRLVVPIAPHGFGRARYVTDEEVAAAAAEAVRPPTSTSVTSANNSGTTLLNSMTTVTGTTTAGTAVGAISEDEVPVHQPGTPRVLNEEANTFRWNPYRVRE